MSNIRVIEADKRRARRNTVMSNNNRVAAYCRVSTDTEEQQSSYHSQVMHYENLINAKNDWDMVDIYADEGISGTGTKNRVEFQRMINDAMDGKIDLIITKSISRFARNTLDTLNYVRTLKEKNVAVMFEKENINTLTMNGEMLLVILSSLAQQESESISANVNLGIKMKRKRGELIGSHGCLGYDYDHQTKLITINEDEAEIVKYIFRRYVEGVGCSVISRELQNLGYKTRKGSSKWHDSTVRGIIKNEKYKGDILMGKTFTTDPLTHRRLQNFGERDQYYLEKHHEPIISDEMFRKAQEVLMKRSRHHGRESTAEKYSRKHAFSSLCKCSYCGSILIRRKLHSGTNHEKYAWQCSNSIKNGRKACKHSKAIDEKLLEEAFIRGYNKLFQTESESINEFVKNIEAGLDIVTLEAEYEQLSADAEKNDDKMQKLIDMNLEGKIDIEIFEKKMSVLKTEQETTVENKRKVKESLDSDQSISMRLESFKQDINTTNLMDEFDRLLLEAIIENVVVGVEDENGEPIPRVLTFVLKTGIKISEDAITNVKKNMIGIDEAKTYSFTTYKDDEVCSYTTRMPCGNCAEDSEGYEGLE